MTYAGPRLTALCSAATGTNTLDQYSAPTQLPTRNAPACPRRATNYAAALITYCRSGEHCSRLPAVSPSGDRTTRCDAAASCSTRATTQFIRKHFDAVCHNSLPTFALPGLRRCSLLVRLDPAFLMLWCLLRTPGHTYVSRRLFCGPLRRGIHSAVALLPASGSLDRSLIPMRLCDGIPAPDLPTC